MGTYFLRLQLYIQIHELQARNCVITSVTLCMPLALHSWFTHPTPSAQSSPGPLPPPPVIPAEGKSTCRHGFMAALPATLKPHANRRWAEEKERKKLTTSDGASEIPTDWHRHKQVKRQGRKVLCFKLRLPYVVGTDSFNLHYILIR